MSDTKKTTAGSKIKETLLSSLSGMSLGLFSTLIIGLIIKQIGALVGDNSVGAFLLSIGSIATMLTGAAIGIGIAYNLKAHPLIIFSTAVTGFIGANASAIVKGTFILAEGGIKASAGDPLGAMLAALTGVLIAKLIAGKTKVDILLVPMTTIISGSAVAYLVGPPISSGMLLLGELIGKATEMQPFLMGVILSVVMGFCLTFPLSSAALSVILNLSGLPAGAATVGCCCQMVGFAAESFRENGVGGLISQGIGTSKIQLPNILKNPYTYVPVLVSSIILGPVSTLVFKMTNNAAGAGMGTAGLVGPIMTYQTMTSEGVPGSTVLIKILIIQIILPFVITLGVSEFMRKKGLIKPGDLKLNI